VKKLIIIFFSFSMLLHAWSIEEAYPSSSFVFSEFDVSNDYVDDAAFEAFVLKNERKIKRFYKSALKRGKYLLPMMKNRLMHKGLSDLFIYISMVESGFATDIVSPKKAVGLWQFMPQTAKDFHLKVCEGEDERCDPVSATDAAIAYLNRLHKKFGKWYLAVMAYNCGEGRLQQAITRAQSNSLEILTDDNKAYLPKETRDYIRKILLAAMIGEDIHAGFDAMEKSSTKQGYIAVEVHKGVCWAEISRFLEMDTEQLKKINPKYPDDCLHGKKEQYTIMIPEEKIYAFYLRYELQNNTDILDTPYMVSYEVKMGDTLEAIAKKFHAATKEIKRANHLIDEYLELGSLLIIPVSEKDFKNLAQ